MSQPDKLKRCKLCTQPITKDWKALWCYKENCPHTNQHYPTEEQIEKYGMEIEKIPRRARAALGLYVSERMED